MTQSIGAAMRIVRRAMGESRFVRPIQAISTSRKERRWKRIGYCLQMNVRSGSRRSRPMTHRSSRITARAPMSATTECHRGTTPIGVRYSAVRAKKNSQTQRYRVRLCRLRPLIVPPR